jgi:photosystem II stability/assembly factor-like uncharacterized protein
VKIIVGTREGAYIVDQAGSQGTAEVLTGQSVLSLCQANGSILAGTENGIFRSADGSSWQASGCDGREIRAIAATSSDIYAGTRPAALYRSVDGGCSWSEVESLTKIPGSEEWGLPGDPTASRALAIVFDSAEPSRFWVGVEVGGIMETRDGGATWQAGLAGQNPDIHALARDPGRSNVLYATTGFGRTGPGGAPETQSRAGTYRSDDGGASWRYIWLDLEHRYTRPSCVDARAPYAVTVASAPTFRSSYRDAEGAQSMLYQSTDGGDTWSPLGDAMHSPSVANLTAVAPADESGSVLVGTDSGEVWRVSTSSDWTLLATGLPHVQVLLPLE